MTAVDYVLLYLDVAMGVVIAGIVYWLYLHR